MSAHIHCEDEDPLIALKHALDKREKKNGKFKILNGLIVFDDFIHLRSIALKQALRADLPAKKRLDEQRI